MDENTADILLAQVIRQARALALPLSKGIDGQVRFNTRAVSRFGCCIQQGERYVIELSAHLMAAGEQAMRETLTHEVLHTCQGCKDHGARWKRYAAAMNAAYGYHISRTGTWESMGLADLKPANYLLVCQHCGQEFRRTRASAIVLHPERYRCKCGGTLKRYDLMRGDV